MNRLVGPFLEANLAACAFAYVAAYATHMYNWLNVGGGSSQFKEQWIILADIAPYFALLLWLGVVVSTIVCWRKLGFTWSLTITFASVLAAPSLFVGVALFLNRNLPLSPI